MGILSWIVIGGLAGLAARFVTKRHLGLIVTIIVGIIGASSALSPAAGC